MRRKTTACDPTAPDSAPTRERVLEVACRLFAEVGYHGTHLREICKRAGANVAGVCYYFRSKEGLYRAVALEAGRQLANPDEPAHPPALEGPPERRLQAAVESLFAKLRGRRVWIAKLLARELIDPVGDASVLAGTGLEREFIFLQQAIRTILGADATPDRIVLHALSTAGECIFACLAEQNLHRVWPDVDRQLPDRTRLAQHVVQRCLGALERELRERPNALPT